MAYDRCFIYKSSRAWYRSSGRQSGHGPHKRVLNPKVHMAADSFGMPVNLTITDGTTSDCSQATEVISDIQAEFLTAGRVYDSSKVLEKIEKRGMNTVIPPEKKS